MARTDITPDIAIVAAHFDRSKSRGIPPGQPAGGAIRSASPVAADGQLRIGFVMEQVLGHVTWSRNLRHAIDDLEGIEARWVETSLYDAQGLLERLPGVPQFVRGGVRGYLDTRRRMRRWRPDVLFFNTQKPASLSQWDMWRTPTLLMTDVTPRQYDDMAREYEHAPDGNAALRFVKHQVNVLNFRLARAVIPWSSWTRDSLVRDYGVPAERTHVIPPGVDTNYWQPSPQREAERVRLLFVGGNFERKGGRLLLDVFSSLGLADRAELHVVTRDTVRPALGVTVHTNVQNNSAELLRLYHEADAFVLPTLADCFSIASIEAMAVGLPVITSAVGGIPDIVVDGETGYLVPAADGGALGRALLALVDDSRRRRAFGGAARRRVVERFDAATNARRIVDLARAVAREPRSSTSS